MQIVCLTLRVDLKAVPPYSYDALFTRVAHEGGLWLTIFLISFSFLWTYLLVLILCNWLVNPWPVQVVDIPDQWPWIACTLATSLAWHPASLSSKCIDISHNLAEASGKKDESCRVEGFGPLPSKHLWNTQTPKYWQLWSTDTTYFITQITLVNLSSLDTACTSSASHRVYILPSTIRQS